jgi:hypothetical protein
VVVELRVFGKVVEQSSLTDAVLALHNDCAFVSQRFDKLGSLFE